MRRTTTTTAALPLPCQEDFLPFNLPVPVSPSSLPRWRRGCCRARPSSTGTWRMWRQQRAALAPQPGTGPPALLAIGGGACCCGALWGHWCGAGALCMRRSAACSLSTSCRGLSNINVPKALLSACVICAALEQIAAHAFFHMGRLMVQSYSGRCCASCMSIGAYCAARGGASMASVTTIQLAKAQPHCQALHPISNSTTSLSSAACVGYGLGHVWHATKPWISHPTAHALCAATSTAGRAALLRPTRTWVSLLPCGLQHSASIEQFPSCNVVHCWVLSFYTGRSGQSESACRPS